MSTGAYAKNVVRIGTEGAYPPFNYLDKDGNLQGFDIDIAKALCDAADMKCTFVTQSWDGMIPALLARKYDAIIASMSITEERKQRVDFTKKYYQTPARFVRQKGSQYRDHRRRA
jgi:arginine/ornithine transport system substrate-binding protein